MTNVINPFPFSLTNGTIADASEVMANLNQIRGDVNTAFASIAPVQGYRGAVVTTISASQLLLGANTVANNLILFDTEVVDTSSVFNISSPTKLVVPSGVSLVRVIGQVDLSLLSGIALLIRIFKNGDVFLTSPVVARQSLPNGTTNTTTQIVSSAISVTPGDYFELAVRISSTATADTLPQTTWFEMQILG